jgi:hypothetical protein
MGGIAVAPLFPLGLVTLTPGAIETIRRAGIHPGELLRRHASGDWGDVDDEDRAANNWSVDHGLRLLSAYGQPPDRLWIITEADRSVTTILRPDEY